MIYVKAQNTADLKHQLRHLFPRKEFYGIEAGISDDNIFIRIPRKLGKRDVSIIYYDEEDSQ
jgi:hypothetical protein